jgi:hypothetical protein
MKRTFAIAAASALLSVGCTGGCDPGSTVTSEAAAQNRCLVTAESNDDGFRVEITYSCEGADHTECYQIEALTCGDEPQTLAAPIPIASCPGGSGYCVDDCAANATGGTIWDTPELLDIPACNTYEQ